MSEAERRAVRRAAVLLLALSVARWGWARSRPAAVPDAPDVLPGLIEGSETRAEDVAARSEPLAEGERIDPNRADERQLDRLPGVGPSTARAIVRERREGGAFRGPSDLARVPGIGAATVERIARHLDFGAGAPPGLARTAARGAGAASGRVDVNSADAEGLQRLPGVGPALAERILAERRVRPFRSVDELARVPGIGPATVARLKERATVGGGRR